MKHLHTLSNHKLNITKSFIKMAKKRHRKAHRRRRGGNTNKVIGAFKSAKKVYDTIAKGVGFAGTSKKLSRAAQGTALRVAKARLGMIK